MWKGLTISCQGCAHLSSLHDTSGDGKEGSCQSRERGTNHDHCEPILGFNFNSRLETCVLLAAVLCKKQYKLIRCWNSFLARLVLSWLRQQTWAQPKVIQPRIEKKGICQCQRYIRSTAGWTHVQSQQLLESYPWTWMWTKWTLLHGTKKTFFQLCSPFGPPLGKATNTKRPWKSCSNRRKWQCEDGDERKYKDRFS